MQEIRWLIGKSFCAAFITTVDVRFPAPSRDRENVQKNECK